MLWNWDTIDACFISTSWQIKSRGMFAGSCIGVVLLVMLLEALRRMSKEYDRYILRRFKRQVALDASYSRNTTTTSSDPEEDPTNNKTAQQNAKAVCTPPLRFRPSLVQQSIRALLHMVTFAVAYFVMLLAMYYNGYFIICIFIGAYLGGFVFSWESISVSVE
jgi:copper transporter 1